MKHFKWWIYHLYWKWEYKRYCKSVGYNCPDCIYHEWLWDEDGITFRGNNCQWGMKTK